MPACPCAREKLHTEVTVNDAERRPTTPDEPSQGLSSQAATKRSIQLRRPEATGNAIADRKVSLHKLSIWA
jgi:hypothetical protein